MPVYRFKCSECNTVFEEKRSVNDLDQPATCPNGHQNAKRIFTVPSVVFKGSGFYSTDHRPKSSSSN